MAFDDEGQNLLTTIGGKYAVGLPLAAAVAGPTLAVVASAAALTQSDQFIAENGGSGGQLRAGSYGTPGLTGTLPDATYGYRLTPLFNGSEGQPGPETTIILAAGGLGMVRITVTAAMLPAGADGFNIYGRTPAGELLLLRVPHPGSMPWSVVDTGDATPGGALPVAGTFLVKAGGGRLHRIHVPGAGGVLGNVTAKDSLDASGASGQVLYGPTMAVASSVADLQIPFRNGLVIVLAAATTPVIAFS